MSNICTPNRFKRHAFVQLAFPFDGQPLKLPTGHDLSFDFGAPHFIYVLIN